MASENIGPRGLLIYGKNSDTGRFDYVSESTWRKQISYPAQGQPGPVGNLAQLNVALARLGGSVFVDLDQLDLPAPQGATGGQESGPMPSPTEDSIIVKELGRLYVVPKRLWQSAELEAAGDAAVLVERHAVVASIPSSPIPVGTFCVLINVAALSR